MSEQESPLAEALRVLAERGVIQRNQATDILENHGWLVSVGELPELERGVLHEKLVAAPDTTGSNVAGISAKQTPDFVPESESPASLGSFGVLNGTLSVDRSSDDRETTEVPTLTDEDLEAIDEASVAEDETATTVKKRGKKH